MLVAVLTILAAAFGLLFNSLDNRIQSLDVRIDSLRTELTGAILARGERAPGVYVVAASLRPYREGSAWTTATHVIDVGQPSLLRTFKLRLSTEPENAEAAEGLVRQLCEAGASSRTFSEFEEDQGIAVPSYVGFGCATTVDANLLRETLNDWATIYETDPSKTPTWAWLPGETS